VTTPHDRLLLLGSTELTLAVADRIIADGRIPLAGIMSAPKEFQISYSATPVVNARYADVSAWCAGHGTAFASYTAPADITRFGRETGATLALLAGWYHMVPADVRAFFARGCIGVHASLLPRYRGGAPLNWALLNGDAEAGVSLFELTDGVDDGALYDQRRFAIEPDDYIGDLVRKAEEATLAMVSDALPAVVAGTCRPRPQQGTATYALQRQPSDAAIDWRHSAHDIARLVRSASRPYPGARTALDGAPLTVWRARAALNAPQVFGVPGQIARIDVLPSPAVVTGDGLLLIEEVEGPDGFNLQRLARSHQRRLEVVQR